MNYGKNVQKLATQKQRISLSLKLVLINLLLLPLQTKCWCVRSHLIAKYTCETIRHKIRQKSKGLGRLFNVILLTL